MAKRRFKLDPNDFIILIMGPAGSGKTNFINTLTGNAGQQTGSLKSRAQDVTPYPLLHDGVRLVFVDTPGFDDTYRSDFDTLRIISDWMTQRYADGTTITVTGIIYPHRINENRMSGSVYKNLRMFGRLCGNIVLHRVRLVTTMWDDAKNLEAAADRETWLKSDFWRPLLDAGAIAMRFDNTPTYAWNIVRELIALGKDGNQLLLQEELVELHKRLYETEAGKVLHSRFQQLLAEQKKTLKDLADEAKLANDAALAKSLQKEYDKINTQLQNTFEQMKEMKIPLSRRILFSLSGRKSRGQAVELEA